MKVQPIWVPVGTAIVLTVMAGVGWYLVRRSTVQPLPEQTAEQADDAAYEKMLYRPALAKDAINHLLDGECHQVRSGRDLPEAIRNAFATLTREKTFELAEPGERFQATDVGEPGLPRRRLILAGWCGTRWFIHYEHGGIGLSRMVVVMDRGANGTVTVVWGGYLREEAHTAADLGSQIEAANPDGSQSARIYW